MEDDLDVKPYQGKYQGCSSDSAGKPSPLVDAQCDRYINMSNMLIHYSAGVEGVSASYAASH